MKHIFYIASIMLVSQALSGQNTMPIGISFGPNTYQIMEATPYDQISASGVADDLQFFQHHFSEEDYTVYRSFYPDNSCRASAEDFMLWRQQLRTKVITPITRYLIHTEHDTLSIISYSITSAIGTQFFPFALQRKNHKWYLLEIRKSEALINLKMFMALVQPDFINAFLENQEQMKAKYLATLFTAKGTLNGDLMMNYYDARYDVAEPRHELARQTFHEVAVFPESISNGMQKNIRDIAIEYNIPSSRMAILENMVMDGNYSMALSKIAEWSDTFDVIEITNKFNSSVNAHASMNGKN